MRILLLENDRLTLESVSSALIEQNYRLDVASDGLLGWDYVKKSEYNLVLTAVDLPRLDGIDLCRKLRQGNYWMPILLMNSQYNSTTKIQGLDAGADDYIVKPFDLEELLARVRALLRRGQHHQTQVLQWEGIHLNPTTCEATYEGRPLDLTPTEYNLLKLFLSNSRRVFSRSTIVDQLWPLEDPPAEDTVKSYIKNLRQKLKAAGGTPDLIDTVYGLGYRLKPSAHSKHKTNLVPDLKLTHEYEATIVLVSADHQILRIIAPLLKPRSINLLSFTDIQSCLDYLKNFSPELVILDLEASQVESLKLCQTIRNDICNRSTCILCLVHQLSHHVLEKIFSSGADDYIHKPILEPEFVHRVSKHLEKSRLLRQMIPSFFTLNQEKFVATS